MIKVCPACSEPKDTELFNKKLAGFSTYCKACTSGKRKGWKRRTKEEGKADRLRYRDKDPEHYYRVRRFWTNKYRRDQAAKHRVWDLMKDLKKYGLSLEDFQRMEREQNHVCKVCKKPNDNGRRLCVYHDHETGKARGLLCNSCNALLGMAKDSVLTLFSAIEYLQSVEAN